MLNGARRHHVADLRLLSRLPPSSHHQLNPSLDDTMYRSATLNLRAARIAPRAPCVSRLCPPLCASSPLRLDARSPSHLSVGGPHAEASGEQHLEQGSPHERATSGTRVKTDSGTDLPVPPPTALSPARTARPPRSVCLRRAPPRPLRPRTSSAPRRSSTRRTRPRARATRRATRRPRRSTTRPRTRSGTRWRPRRQRRDRRRPTLSTAARTWSRGTSALDPLPLPLPSIQRG